jgi:hypothetical protein
MNPIGLFTVIVLLFVIYKFLKMVYEMGVRRVREGYTEKRCGCPCRGFKGPMCRCGPVCRCK